MKVLLIGEASKVHRNLKRGLEHHEVSCDHYTLTKQGVWNTSEFAFAPNVSGAVGRVSRNVVPLAKTYMLPKYDVINFVNTISAVIGSKFRYLDLPILRKKARLLSYYALGCDQIGIVKKNPALPYAPCNGCTRDGATLSQDCSGVFVPEYEASTARVSKYFDVGSCSMIEYDHVSPLFDRFARIPLPVIVEELPFEPVGLRKTVRIAHTPTRKGYKGTGIVLEAIEKLRAVSSDFEFELIEGLPYPEYVERMRDIDVVIDQVYSQSAGMNGLEMLAAGKVVLTGASAMGRTYFPFGNECPALDAPPDPSALAQTLSDLLRRKSEFPALSRHGRDFVTQHHDHRKVAGMFIDLWNAEPLAGRKKD